MEQRWWNGGTSDGRTVKQSWWNRDGGTVKHLMVEQQNISWWNSGTSDRGTVEHLMVEQSNRNGGTVEQRWESVDNLMVEHLNNHGGTVQHLMVER